MSTVVNLFRNTYKICLFGATNDSELYTLSFINHAGLDTKLTCIQFTFTLFNFKGINGVIFVVLRNGVINGVMFFILYKLYLLSS